MYCSGSSHLPFSYLPELINWALPRCHSDASRGRDCGRVQSHRLWQWQQNLSNGRQPPADIISIMSFTGQRSAFCSIHRRCNISQVQLHGVNYATEEPEYTRIRSYLTENQPTACNRFVSHFICHNFRLIFMSIIKLRWWAKLHSKRCMKGAATSETPQAYIYYNINMYIYIYTRSPSRENWPSPWGTKPARCRKASQSSARGSCRRTRSIFGHLHRCTPRLTRWES